MINVCKACAQKCQADQLYRKVQPHVEAIFRELNGGDANKIAEAFFQAITHEHRYLQNEFFILLWKFFAKYGAQSENGYDARNEGAVRWAKLWDKAV